MDFLRGTSMHLISRFDFNNLNVLFPSIRAQVCSIYKNGRTAIHYVSCLLAAINAGQHQDANWLLSQKTAQSAAYSRSCNNIMSVFWANKNDKFQKFVFVRDPLERFAYGWLFICQRYNICLGCGEDISCFLRTLFGCWNTISQNSTICTSNFISFHMAPQAAYCEVEFRQKLKKYSVIDYSRDAVNDFLLEAALPVLNTSQYETVKYLLWNIPENPVLEIEVDNLKRKIVSDRSLASMFSVLYFVDYDAYSITLPQFIVDLELYNPI